MQGICTHAVRLEGSSSPQQGNSRGNQAIPDDVQVSKIKGRVTTVPQITFSLPGLSVEFVALVDACSTQMSKVIPAGRVPVVGFRQGGWHLQPKNFLFFFVCNISTSVQEVKVHTHY